MYLFNNKLINILSTQFQALYAYDSTPSAQLNIPNCTIHY